MSYGANIGVMRARGRQEPGMMGRARAGAYLESSFGCIDSWLAPVSGYDAPDVTIHCVEPAQLLCAIWAAGGAIQLHTRVGEPGVCNEATI